MSAHDELRELIESLLLGYDNSDAVAAAARLAPRIAEWAKDQDEDWPWDDGTPAPEPTDWSTHPSITDPGWLARAQEHAIWAQGFLRRMFRDPGNPAAFQAVTHRELGHPVDETTHALAEQWAQKTPLPERWQPRVRIPAGTALSRYGVTLVVDPTIPRDTIRITSRPRPLFRITWRTS